MSLYINNLFFNYISADEFFTVVYVLLVAVSFGLYRLHLWFKNHRSFSDFNDITIHRMDNYTFNFEHSEVAVSEKKLGVVTKIVVWCLIAFFVVTPFYEVIATLEPGHSGGDVFMNCFRGLQ